MGTVFKIQPNGTGDTVLLNFAGTSNGSYPYGSLFSDGAFLYGMTQYGGANSLGTLFRIKTDGTGDTILLNFAGTNGSFPYGSLISDGTFLYGMTTEGGTNSLGTIFKIMPDGTGYAKLHDFAGGTDGQYPSGSLVYDGTYLYGMTNSGGSTTNCIGSGCGIIFKIKPNGTGYTKLLDFQGAANGRNPKGSLIYDGGFLYGMTQSGGTSDMGTIFKIDSSGANYSKLLDFSSSNGVGPEGSLVSDGSYLYGMTFTGGAINNFGVLFKIKQDGTNYSKLFDFDGTANGRNPKGSLFSDGTSLWGMTYGGGTNDYGVIFKFYLPCALPSAPSICAVTVDSLSQYNVIYWDKTMHPSADSFLVYREVTTGAYTKIGAHPYAALSEYTDTARSIGPANGDPNVGTYRYKLAVKDTCGNISPQSPYHNSVFFVDNNNGSFTWNSYDVEGTTTPVTQFDLMRDDANTGVWVLVGSVSGTQNTLNDPQYATYQSIANWRVEAQGFNCTSTQRLENNAQQGVIVKSKSNITNNRVIGIRSNHIADVSIYPNPSSGKFVIAFGAAQDELHVKIVSALGEEVFRANADASEELLVDLGKYADGVYFVQISSVKGTVTRRVVKNK